MSADTREQRQSAYIRMTTVFDNRGQAPFLPAPFLPPFLPFLRSSDGGHAPNRGNPHTSASQGSSVIGDRPVFTRSFLRVRFYALLPYSRRLCTVWAEVTVAARSHGCRIECADAWIAATALRSGVPLVTHNAADYQGVPG